MPVILLSGFIPKVVEQVRFQKIIDACVELMGEPEMRSKQ